MQANAQYSCGKFYRNFLCFALFMLWACGAYSSCNPSAFGPLPQFVTSTGAPASGYQLYFFVGGSTSTPQTTYTDATCGTPNTNPIILDSLGNPQNGIFWTSGQSFKMELATPTDTNPPTSPIWTVDNLKGINDTTVTQSQWVAGPTPTFVGATSFTVAGDQTLVLTAGLRLQITDAITVKYATISTSVYNGSSLTTITTINDGSLSLVSPLSAFNYGLLSATNISIPRFVQAGTAISVTYDSSGRPTINSSYTPPALPRSYLAGLTLSNAAASSGSMVVSAGMAVDSTNTAEMSLASNYTKTSSAWTLGSGVGGLDTGAFAINTWYHWYLIQRPDTGVVDCIFSLSASAPTLPANYTLYRYIGSSLSDTTLHWVPFTQQGDFFEWTTPVLESTSASPGTNAVTQTLANIPTGFNVRAFLNAMVAAATTNAYISDLATTDLAVSNTTAPLPSVGTVNSTGSAAQVTVRTNTSAQIRTRNTSNAQLFLVTLGWFDRRGQDQ